MSPQIVFRDVYDFPAHVAPDLGDLTDTVARHHERPCEVIDVLQMTTDMTLLPFHEAFAHIIAN